MGKSNIVPLPPRHTKSCSGFDNALDALLRSLAHHAKAAVVAIEEAKELHLAKLREFTPQDRLLTLEQAAAYLSIGTRTLYRWTSTGSVKLPFILLGSEKRFRLRDLDAFLTSKTISPRAVKL